ncbi:unnamed protein product [Vitrella brassicaformis CCMP3155]|uniref:Uncharacterized protein n=2 Tax=Vitrella brassicaformis TaxID=1169539 RepID=A0A0G4EAV2_VITBC|nr:unnamed protein product [Vitrella brassicaformis CCMP3155]|mmetsp:Transcript_17027/g.40914  ORF Transcript_17027/g.40914 Transcript_17027/m.40914 type:complete len:363 (+) Transcript_17027:99-1187(+)|eukprot:CEL92793.1 unnamed protein product [Vitrella brassicaformis CCMP3155]
MASVEEEPSSSSAAASDASPLPSAAEREGLKEVLQSKSRDELLEMCTRMARSIQSLEELHALEVEQQQELKDESTRLHTTLEQLLSSTKELKIGSRQTQGRGDGDFPALSVSGTFRFVSNLLGGGRGQHSPVAVNEHVGDLTRNQVDARSRQAPHKEPSLWEKLSSLDLDVPSVARLKKPPRKAIHINKPFINQQQQQRRRIPGGPFAQCQVPSIAPSLGGLYQRAPAPASPFDTLDPMSVRTKAGEGAAAADSRVGEEFPSKEVEVERNVVVATVTIADGSQHQLCVRATESCQSAAERFAAQHNLKKTAIGPLTAYLTQVDDEAETYPVAVEADLATILQAGHGQQNSPIAVSSGAEGPH